MATSWQKKFGAAAKKCAKKTNYSACVRAALGGKKKPAKKKAAKRKSKKK